MSTQRTVHKLNALEEFVRLQSNLAANMGLARGLNGNREGIMTLARLGKSLANSGATITFIHNALTNFGESHQSECIVQIDNASYSNNIKFPYQSLMDKITSSLTGLCFFCCRDGIMTAMTCDRDHTMTQ